MRTAPILLGLTVALLSLASLGADAEAKGKKQKKPKPRADTSVLFMASDPHVPLAITDKGSFVPFEVAGKRCGDPKKWAKVGSSWRALDAWGQVAGEFTIASKERYDVTGCDEVTMTKTSGEDGAKLFVSGESWKPKPTVEFAATDAQRAAFAKALGAALDLYGAPPKAKERGASGFRVAYFSAPKTNDDGTHPTEAWAIATGPMLVFAHLVDDAWKVTRAEPPFDRDYDGVDHFKLVSIFDMDGDGSPEVIVNENNLDAWNEEVFSLVEPCGWSAVVVSPGGSTA